MEREIILHLAAAPITFVARLKLPTDAAKPLAALGRAFARALRKKHPHLGLRAFTLAAADAAGTKFADDAVVGDLGTTRALAVVPARASRTAARVVALLASHVNGARRLESFVACLSSIAAQSALPDALVVGLSTTPDLAAPTRRAVDRCAAALAVAGVDVNVEFAAAPRAQFQHYYATLPLLKTWGDDTWCVFSDDDDFWHADRLRVYDAAISETEADAHVSPVYALNTAPLGAVPEPDTLKTVVSKTGQPSNYYDVAVRLGLWRECVFFFLFFGRPRDRKGTSRRRPGTNISRSSATTTGSLGFTRAASRCRSSQSPTAAGCPSFFLSFRFVPDAARARRYLWRQDHGRTAQHVAAMREAHAPVVRAGLEAALADRDVLGRFRAAVPGARPETPAATLVATFCGDVVKAERTVELSRVWFYHGHYRISDVEEYLDVFDAPAPPGEADPAVKALLFPQQHADALERRGLADYLRRARPDVDVDADDDRCRRFLRDYVRRRLVAAAARRYAHRPLAAADVAAAFAAAHSAFHDAVDDDDAPEPL